MGEFSIFHWLIVLSLLAVFVGLPVAIYYLIRLIKKPTR